MAVLHSGAQLTPDKIQLAQGWIGTRRWYAGKGGRPSLTTLGVYRFDDPAGEVGLEVILFVDDSAAAPVLYQVPMSYRGAPLAGAESALIGTMEHSVLGTRWVYDACYDPVFAQALLHVMVSGGHEAELEAHDVSSGAVSIRKPPVTVQGRPHRSGGDPRVTSSHVLSGEQSNTSIILAVADGNPLIIKLFRVLHAGDNPDVTLQAALSSVGSSRVPALVASLRGEWPGDPDQRVSGDLAFVQEFFPNVRDAWREALDAAAAGDSFTAEARTLGEATAEVHAELAEALPTAKSDAASIASQLETMRERFAAAVDVVPELGERSNLYDALLDSARTTNWPALQRIHGDLHLGQVLDVPDRGWVLLDFEGEPLRPLDERNALDVPLRDVAGILRSFDYVAGAVRRTGGTELPDEWAGDARTAFLEGYAARSGVDLASYQLLIGLFEIDKAAYEVVYEARNRPDWLAIPRDALLRILPGSAS